MNKHASGIAIVALVCGLGLSCSQVGTRVSEPEPPHTHQPIQIVDAMTMPTPVTLKAPVRITEISTFDALTFDPRAKTRGTLSYRLSKPVWVRVRVRLRGDEQLVLRTLVDWSQRPMGKNTETWDGRDAAGHVVNKAKFPCFIVIEADSEMHQKHARTLCRDLRLELKLKGSPTGPVNGNVDVQVALDEKTKGYGDKLGYKVRAYVDFELVHAFSVKPGAGRELDFSLETTDLSAGEHLLTVVVDDGADHIGSSSLRFNVKP